MIPQRVLGVKGSKGGTLVLGRKKGGILRTIEFMASKPAGIIGHPGALIRGVKGSVSPGGKREHYAHYR